jgi:hypothetical protein
MNAAKTWTPKRETYAEWLQRQRAQRQEIAEILQTIAARREADYEAEEEGVELERVRIDPVLERGFLDATGEDAPWGASPDGYAASRRIGVSLRELGRTGSTAPLERMESVLYRHAHLTKELSRYVRRRVLAGFEEDTVPRVAGILARDDVPYRWQTGWLLHALIPVEQPLPQEVIDVALNLLHDPAVPGFIRGRAAVLLARELRLPLGQELADSFENVGPATQPDLVAAAALLPQSAETRRFLKAASRDPLLATVAQEAGDLGLFEL